MVKHSGSSYFVGRILGELLASVTNGLTVDKAIQQVSANYKIPEEHLLTSYQRGLRELGFTKRGGTNPNSYIKLQVSILTNSSVSWIGAVFQHLFKKYLATALILVSTLVLATTFLPKLDGSLGKMLSFLVTFPLLLKWEDILQLFLYLLLGAIVHEFGHAGAAYKFGTPSKRIGAGIVVCFPVLFCDVSDIWRLSKEKRIVVNFGGVYVQLIYVAILSGIHLISGDPVLLYATVATLIAMLMSLSPFLRFDGYWIYADAFERPNLRSEALLYLRQLPYQAAQPHVDWSVKTYAFGYCLFVLLACVVTMGILSVLIVVFPFVWISIFDPTVEVQIRAIATMGLYCLIIGRLLLYGGGLVPWAWRFVQNSRNAQKAE